MHIDKDVIIVPAPLKIDNTQSESPPKAIQPTLPMRQAVAMPK